VGLTTPQAAGSPPTPTTASRIVPQLELLTLVPSSSPPSFLLLSPLREAALAESIPFTPAGEQASVFKFYCPLCMEFYKSILKSGQCCGNYICLGCTLDYLGTKNLKGLSSCNDIMAAQAQLKCIACPSCSTTGFHPKIVLSDETVRDYSYVVATTKTTVTGKSPVRRGDSFDDLKRKMLPFQMKSTLQEQHNERMELHKEDDGDEVQVVVPLYPSTNDDDDGDSDKQTLIEQIPDDFFTKEANEFLVHIIGTERIDRLVKRMTASREKLAAEDVVDEVMRSVSVRILPKLQ